MVIRGKSAHLRRLKIWEVGFKQLRSTYQPWVWKAWQHMQVCWCLWNKCMHVEDLKVWSNPGRMHIPLCVLSQKCHKVNCNSSSNQCTGEAARAFLRMTSFTGTSARPGKSRERGGNNSFSLNAVAVLNNNFRNVNANMRLGLRILQDLKCQTSFSFSSNTGICF